LQCEAAAHSPVLRQAPKTQNQRAFPAALTQASELLAQIKIASRNFDRATSGIIMTDVRSSPVKKFAWIGFIN